MFNKKRQTCSICQGANPYSPESVKEAAGGILGAVAEAAAQEQAGTVSGAAVPIPRTSLNASSSLAAMWKNAGFTALHKQQVPHIINPWDAAYPGTNQTVMQVFISRMRSALNILIATPASWQSLAAKIRATFPDPSQVYALFLGSNAAYAGGTVGTMPMRNMSDFEGGLPPSNAPLFWQWVHAELNAIPGGTMKLPPLKGFTVGTTAGPCPNCGRPVCPECGEHHE